jgi:hypothetical protein
MNIPINFHKLDGQEFTVSNYKFFIESDYHSPGDVWIWCKDGPKSLNPLCIEISWREKKYSIISCNPGQGRTGKIIINNANLLHRNLSDVNTFINSFIADTVRVFIENKII